MIKTGLIGHPVHHSKSPLIHEYWMNRYGIKGTYSAIDIPPASLAPDFRKLINEGYRGFNVTVPHKENIMTLCQDCDDVAQKIGAVNTIVIENQKIKGLNTDAFGFIQNIKQEAPDFDFKDVNVLILGAGGAAKAVLYGLQKEGVGEIFLTNRTREKAGNLALQYKNVRAVDWSKRQDNIQQIDLLVNTTTLGMNAQDKLLFDLKDLKNHALVCDIVYAPLYTDLLQQAKAQGNKIVTGIGMLLHQARGAFAAWHGIMPDIDKTLETMVLR